MKALVVVLALVGCDQFDDPTVGPLLHSPVDGPEGLPAPSFGCVDAPSDPSVVVSFENDVRPLMFQSPGGCMPCHLGRVTSGLDLSSYDSMRRGGDNSGTNIIIPMKPCESILPQKLSPTPPFGSRMPFNGPPYFSATQLQVVRDWIAEGALDN
jgi:hypothetical protein